MSLVDPQHTWLARVMLVLGFVAIAVLAFVGRHSHKAVVRRLP
jgi:hypothetical protein